MILSCRLSRKVSPSLEGKARLRLSSALGYDFSWSASSVSSSQTSSFCPTARHYYHLPTTSSCYLSSSYSLKIQGLASSNAHSAADPIKQLVVSPERFWQSPSSRSASFLGVRGPSRSTTPRGYATSEMGWKTPNYLDGTWPVDPMFAPRGGLFFDPSPLSTT